MNLVLVSPWFPNVAQFNSDGSYGRGWTLLAATDHRIVAHVNLVSFSADDGYFHARTLRS